VSVKRFLLRALSGWPPPPGTFARELLAGTKLVAIDVGAAAGLQPQWHALDGAAHIYAFEPHPESCAQLRHIFDASPHRDMYTILPVALSGTGGPRTLFMTKAPTGASILEIEPALVGEWVNREYTYPITPLPIETQTLQAALGAAGEPQADLIKLDIQGAELEVLTGLGPDRLNRLLLAELEINALKVYVGQARFEDVQAFMREIDLELLDVRITRAHRPRDGDPAGYQTRVFGVDQNSPTISARVWEFEAVYTRRPDSVLAWGEAGAVRKLAVAYCLYNFFSEAYHLAERAEKQGVLDPGAASRLKSGIVSWHRKLHYRPYYRPGGPLAWLYRQIIRRTPRQSRRWAQYQWVDYPNA
jgi:FkbM family methyltransferase